MLILDGSALAIHEVVRVARDRKPVAVSAEARATMERSHHAIAAMHRADVVAYGVTTGFGALADRAIPAEQRAELQRALILSHAAGMGPAVEDEVVRAMILLRARTLCAGRSGVRPAVVDALLALLELDAVPWVPEHGSLGASGDLAPLAHVAACLIGSGTLARDGEPVTAENVPRVDLGPKEGLALINGTDGMAGAMALACHDLGQLLVAADAGAAMSIEALLGTERVFDADVIALRAAPGPQTTAANLRALLHGSPLAESHRHSHHAVQDAYSLRCVPQVHGAARDVLDFARVTVQRELASLVDNPIVDDAGVLRSTGNFHGQALAYAADACASVCADVAAMSERRVARLLDPARSRGLPAFLSPDPGVNSGFMVAHYTAAGIVAALRHAATPLGIHSASTSAGQEDHVSMGWTAALRTRRSIRDLRRVIAVEWLCAAQALDLRAPLAPAPGTRTLQVAIREQVAGLASDRFMAPDLATCEELIAEAHWRGAVEAITGPLNE